MQKTIKTFMNFIKRQIYSPVASLADLFAVLIILFGVLWILVPPPPKAIERRVGALKLSMSDAKELYDFKGHMGEVRGRLNLVY